MIVDSEISRVNEDFLGFVHFEKSLNDNNINIFIKILNSNFSSNDCDTFIHKLILIAENIQTSENSELLNSSSCSSSFLKKEILNETKIILLILINSCLQLSPKDSFRLFKYIFLTYCNNKISQESSLITIYENNFKKLSDFLKLSSVFKYPSFEYLKRSNIKNEICMKLICDYIILIYGLYLGNKLELNREKHLNDLHESILLLSFFPNLDVSEFSNYLIICLIEANFKHISEKLELNIQGKDLKLNFFEFFSKFLIEEILDFKFNYLYKDKYSKEIREIFLIVKENFSENKKFLESDFYLLRDLNILVFVYQYRLNLIAFKDKIFTLTASDSSKYKSAIDEIFKSLSFYQQHFYGNFFLNDLMLFVRKNTLNTLYSDDLEIRSQHSNRSIQIKIENIITCCNSEISYFFCLDSFSFNEMFQQSQDVSKNKKIIKKINSTRCINKYQRNSKIEFFEDIKKSILIGDSNKWDKLFRENYILTAVYTIGILSNFKDKLSLTEPQLSLDNFNYNSLFSLQQNFSYFENENENDRDYVTENYRQILKSVSVYYLLFNCDMSAMNLFIAFSGENKMNENIIKFNAELIKLLYLIKTHVGENYMEIKDDLEKLLNDIISTKEGSLIYLIDNDFDENLIKFIIENIESSHISSKYFDDFILSKEPQKILSGFILLGHWANTYPLEYIYTRILDILFIIRKNVDLRLVLLNEDNINKFLKGIYLLFKAFPKLNSEFTSFISYIKENLSTWISDYSLNIYANKQLDKVNYFTEKVLVRSNYSNPNNLFIKLD